MSDIIRQRVLMMADIMIKDNLTVREVAKKVGVSKSTVHKDLQEKLKVINYNLYLNVKKILDYNKNIRHIRGGYSTKIKYLNLDIKNIC